MENKLMLFKKTTGGVKDIIPLWKNPAVYQIHSCNLSI
jgi:hypothetical protein